MASRPPRRIARLAPHSPPPAPPSAPCYSCQGSPLTRVGHTGSPADHFGGKYWVAPSSNNDGSDITGGAGRAVTARARSITPKSRVRATGRTPEPDKTSTGPENVPGETHSLDPA